MGNQQTKRRTKEERAQFKENRSNIINFRKQQIDDFNEQTKLEAIKQIKNSTNDDESLVLLSNMNNTTKLLDISKEQLDREGLVLTKKDLIAVIIALEPSYATKLNEINKNTVPDLNAIIRVIIYDPNRYSNASQNTVNSTDNQYKITNTPSKTNFLKLKW